MVIYQLIEPFTISDHSIHLRVNSSSFSFNSFILRSPFFALSPSLSLILSRSISFSHPFSLYHPFPKFSVAVTRFSKFLSPLALSEQPQNSSYVRSFLFVRKQIGPSSRIEVKYCNINEVTCNRPNVQRCPSSTNF